MSDLIITSKEDEKVGIFKKDEHDLLLKTRKLRMDMIDGMFSNGVPTRSGDMRVANEILSAVDKSVQDSATLRIKHTDSQTEASKVALVAATIKYAKENRHEVAMTSTLPGQEPILEAEILDVELVLGELEIGPQELVIEDFVGGE